MKIPTFKNIVSSIFGGTQNPNRFVTAAELNPIFDMLNKSNLFGSQTFKFLATYAGSVLSTSSVVKQCAAGGSGCWSCLNSCAYQNTNAISAFTRSSAGVYVLVLNDKDYLPYADVSVNVGNLATPGAVASVLKTAAKTYQITTYGTAAGTADDFLSSTLISVEFFASKTAL